MKVSLIYHTPNPERVVATATRLCYSHTHPDDLLEKLSDERIDYLLNTITTAKHYSTFEHAVFMFSISGISRACSHQLVRHRIASYNQQSQRYVTFDNIDDIVVPPSIETNAQYKLMYENAIKQVFDTYEFLSSQKDVNKEDARYLLPNGAKTNLVVTMNARSLMNFFHLRCCRRAQWEINELAWRMLDLVYPIAPRIFRLAGPNCLHGKCSEGKMTCGNPYTGHVTEFVKED